MSKLTLLETPHWVICFRVLINMMKLVMKLDQSCLLKTGVRAKVRAKVRANDVRLVYGWSSLVLRSVS